MCGTQNTCQVIKTSHYSPLKIFISILILANSITSCKKSDDLAVLKPTANTTDATFVGQKWATLNGGVKANNQTNEVYFEYDITSSYRYYIRGIPDTISGNTYTYSHANLTGLTPNTVYYFRIKIVSSTDTIYGGDMTFTTTNPVSSGITFNPNLTYGSVSDIDMNSYKTMLIGTQTWIAENLKVTRYNNGTVIPFIPDVSTWSALSTPGYSYYNSDSVGYGALYNWYAVNTGNICPTGWHVATSEEWTTLISYLGGESQAGGKLKETGIGHWLTPNTSATNETGFTALAGGYRNSSGVYSNIKRSGYWWSSSESSTLEAYYHFVFYNSNNIVNSNSDKTSGFSVRCVKD
jgi:uncharacterized protein (TIGR02145 family)